MRHVFLILSLALVSAAAGQTFVPDPVEGADLFNPTSLDWGPDGRLYIAEQYGVIRILDVSRDSVAEQLHL